jgi:hypothetical protein
MRGGEGRIAEEERRKGRQEKKRKERGTREWEWYAVGWHDGARSRAMERFRGIDEGMKWMQRTFLYCRAE